MTLFTLPLLARHFTVEQYGLFDLFYISVSLLITFFIFGQDSAIFRYFHDEVDDEGRKRIITQTIVLQLILSIIVIGAFFLLKNNFNWYLELSEEIKTFLLIILMILPFGILYTISETILRLTSNLKRYMLLTVSFMFTTLLLVIYGTQVIDANFTQIIKLYFCLWCFFGIFGLVLIRKWLVVPTRLHINNKMLFYGVPMGIIVLIETSQPLLERLIINNIISLEALGLYAVAAKIATILLLPIGAFQMAFMPLVMKTFRDDNAIELFNLALIIYSTFLTLFILVMCALSEHLIIFLAGRAYLGGAYIVFPLSLAIYFQAIGTVLGLGNVISNKTYFRLAIHIISQVVACILMVQLSGKLNILGIAIAVAVGKGLVLILDSAVGQRLYPLAWNYFVVLVMVAIATTCGTYLSFQGIRSKLELGLFISALVGILLIGRSFLNAEQKVALQLWK